MRKFFSDRNIAAALFVFTFLIFVLAQQYTRQNGSQPERPVVSAPSPSRMPAKKAEVEQPTPAAIMAR